MKTTRRRGLLSKSRKTARSGLQNSSGSSENRLKVQTVRAAARADGPKLERQHDSRYRTSIRQKNRYFYLFKFIFVVSFENRRMSRLKTSFSAIIRRMYRLKARFRRSENQYCLPFLMNVSAETASFQKTKDVSLNFLTCLR